MDFAEILGSISGPAPEFRLFTPEGWGQGRALHGGIAAALGLKAAKASFEDLPPLRSAQTTYLEPAAGKLRIVPSMLRQGRSATVVGVDCFSEDKLANRLALTFGADRESDCAYDRVSMPDVQAPEACSRFGWEGKLPAFFDNFDMRQAGVATVGSQTAEDELRVWVKFKGQTGDNREEALLAVADVLPPAALVGRLKSGPISTMSWTIDINQPAPPSEWHLLRSISEQAGGGYSRQNMACWSRDGRCLAVGRQTVAIFF